MPDARARHAGHGLLASGGPAHPHDRVELGRRLTKACVEHERPGRPEKLRDVYGISALCRPVETPMPQGYWTVIVPCMPSWS